jgi:hypothetical protein
MYEIPLVVSHLTPQRPDVSKHVADKTKQWLVPLSSGFIFNDPINCASKIANLRDKY